MDKLLICEFYCKKCDYTTPRMIDWKRHLKTEKHKKIHFICPDCYKVLNNRQGLWRHKKKCKGLLSTTIINNDNKVINNNNNILNINLFLNEHCKDAMNLTDFVDQIKMTLEDLLYTKDHGYVKGLTNVFIKNLIDIKPKERPICCSDVKKKQFYIKEDDKWEKEDEEYNTLMKTLRKMTKEQLIQVLKSNPQVKTIIEKSPDEFRKLVQHTLN